MPDLTSSPALNVAIALSFLFLGLSLVATAIQEAIAALLALRSAKLEDGLRNMLERSDGQKPAAGEKQLATALLDHPLVASHRRRRALDVARWYRPRWWKHGRAPSYISPRVFSLTLLDIIAPNGPESGFSEVRANIEKMSLPANVKARLLLLLDESGNDLGQFRRNAEAWFDDTMARVSGWYKRQAQLILAVIATGLTIALNVNTITIAERIWDDPATRAAVVAAAQSPEVTGALEGDTAQAKLQNAADDADALTGLGIPLGYSGTVWDELEDGKLGGTILGWLLSIAALSLGAPFWFDALSRLSRLRNTGKPETPLPASERGAPQERVRRGL